MALARYDALSNPCNILKTYIEQDHSNAKHIWELSKQNLDRFGPNRVFDSFPILISDKEFSAQVSTFSLMISCISINQLDDDKVLRQIDDMNKHLIAKNVLQVATQGCHGFLEAFGPMYGGLREGRIRPEIRKLLNWEHKIDNLDICSVVCAFVGHTFQTILAKVYNKDQTRIDLPSYNAINNYFNKHYRQWVRDAIEKHGIRYVNLEELAAKRQARQQQGVTTAGYVASAATIGLFAGSALVALAAGVAAAFISGNTSEGDDDDYHDPHLETNYKRSLY